MKLSDVEFQGDKSKAIFYYTADARVDFRELIKVLAEEFKVRIEMRQIGARQEASRLGGIGSCGRELCCSTWLTDFRTVSTSAARYQQLSLNPLKLAHWRHSGLPTCIRVPSCLRFGATAYDCMHWICLIVLNPRSHPATKRPSNHAATRDHAVKTPFPVSGLLDPERWVEVRRPAA